MAKGELPLHRPASKAPKPSRKAETRQVGFEQEGYKSSWQRRAFINRSSLCIFSKRLHLGWRRVVNHITSVSTGSPSDGLGDGTASEGSVPLTFAGAGDADKDDTDWVVDEVVVSDDPDYPHNKSDRGTNTGTRRSDTSSVRHGVNNTEGGEDDQDFYTGGPVNWIRWRAWPAVYGFFDPRFDDSDKELEFQKQSWYSSKAFAFYGAMCTLRAFSSMISMIDLFSL